MTPPPDPDAIIAFLRSLRAVRQFSDDSIPDDVLADIMDVARWSGSAMNRQPWELIVVTDPETLGIIAASSSHAGHVAGARVAIVIALDNAQPSWEAFDDGRLSERIMLAAQAHGVGSCIGWLVPESAGTEVGTLLGIPPGMRLRTVISLGYPATPGRRGNSKGSARKPMSDIVSWETFGNRRP